MVPSVFLLNLHPSTGNAHRRHAVLVLDSTPPLKGDVESSISTACLPRAIPTEVWRTKKKPLTTMAQTSSWLGTCGHAEVFFLNKVLGSGFPPVVGLVARRSPVRATRMLQGRGHLRPRQNQRILFNLLPSKQGAGKCSVNIHAALLVMHFAMSPTCSQTTVSDIHCLRMTSCSPSLRETQLRLFRNNIFYK